ncbi:MAG: hypothetical protein ABIJ91_02800 [Candidatus Kuenenbacteria bacterium]
MGHFFEISPANVPDFEFFGDKIIGYKKIFGQKLTPELFKKFDKLQLNTYIEQLGSFLKILHSSKCEKQTPSEYRNFFNQEGITQLLIKIQKIIFPKVSKNIQDNINNFVPKYFFILYLSPFEIIINGGGVNPLSYL